MELLGWEELSSFHGVTMAGGISLVAWLVSLLGPEGSDPIGKMVRRASHCTGCAGPGVDRACSTWAS